MNRSKSRAISLGMVLLAFLLLVPGTALPGAFGVPVANAAANGQEEAIEGAASYLAQGEISDWSAFALSRAGKKISQSYMDGLTQKLKGSGGKLARLTDYERTALSLKAAGQNPERFAGYNLIQSISSYANATDEGVMGAIFGMLALDSGAYTIAGDAPWNQKAITDVLLKQHISGEGWSLTGEKPSDVDITAMALTALAPYASNSKQVKKATDEALQWLAAQQQDNGGFNNMGDNSESVSQAIIASVALGIDPESAPFHKGMLAHLLSFRQPDGGFAHVMGEKSGEFSTEQALQALTAYQMFADKKGSLFYHIQPDVRIGIQIEGLKSVIAKGEAAAGNVLAALRTFAAAHSLRLEVTDSSYGPYVSAIEGVEAAGSEGWLYAVKRDGQWIYPQVGMADFELKTSDELFVYYGGTTALVHDISIAPELPKAGEPFTVSVSQSSWDWKSNAESVAPAAGIKVSIGDQQVLTDKTGVASFKAISKEGAYSVTVTGYQDKGSPSIVEAEKLMTVIPANADVSLSIEGPHKSLASGLVSAANVLDALKLLSDRSGLPLTIEDSSYGKYVTMIGDVKADKNDGWMFAVKRQGAWIFPQVGMADFSLRPGDDIVVYFGYSAKLISSISLNPSQPKADEPFTVTVKQAGWDWKQNKEVVTPAEGATVRIGDVQSTTDENGTVRLHNGMPFGVYKVEVNGYQAEGSPAVVHESMPLAVYRDIDQESVWSATYVSDAAKYGIMTGGDGAMFAPKSPVTRAELAAVLLRVLHVQEADTSLEPFSDVNKDDWYAGYVQKAKDRGIVNGIDDSRFAPQAPVTREQMAVMLARGLHLRFDPAYGAAKDYADTQGINPEAFAAIQAAAAAGLMNGTGDETFDPNGTVTREMLAAVAVRAIGQVK